MNYREAIVCSIYKIQSVLGEDLSSVTAKDLCRLTLDIYRVLSEAVAPPTWERDADAEAEMQERILSSFEGR